MEKMKIIKIESMSDVIRKSRDIISKIERVGGGMTDSTGKKGVNFSLKLTNDKGKSFLFKPASKEHTSRWRYVPAHSQYKRERVGYLIDQMLGFNLVPKTRIVKFKNEIGSLHDWVNAEHKPDITLKKYSDDMIWKVGLYDLIIGNCDRHSGNWLDYPDNSIVAIDAGYSQPVKMNGLNDPRSVILSRFACKIWGKKIPLKYIVAIKRLKDLKFQEHMKKLLEPEAFDLYRKRLGELLTSGVAAVSGYRCIEKIHGIPPKKGE